MPLYDDATIELKRRGTDGDHVTWRSAAASLGTAGQADDGAQIVTNCASEAHFVDPPLTRAGLDSETDFDAIRDNPRSSRFAIL